MLISPALAFADADKVFKENNKAVVVVKTYNEKGEPISQGSGFIVRADGAVVTNYHVISNAVDIKVKAGDKVLDVEGLIHTDKENDLVILKIKGEKLPVVKLGDIEKANIGEKVYVISSPQGLENTISDGILSGIREITPERKVLQITAPVSPGSSGGPVFNKDGEVIGITTFLIKEAQNLNFAMPVNYIKGKIESKKVTALKESEIEDYKKTAEYWFYLGYYMEEAGLHREAIEAFKQAIRIKPDDAEAFFALGFIYAFSDADLSNLENAVDAYKKAIKFKPDYVNAYMYLSKAYSRLGMYKEALEAIKIAVRLKPDNPEIYFGLGSIYFPSGMYKEAREAFKQSIRIKPDYAEVHDSLGLTYIYLGMYEEAMEAFKQALRIKPDYAPAHYNLGVAYLSINDRVSALEEYKILKDRDPNLAEKLFNLIYR